MDAFGPPFVHFYHEVNPDHWNRLEAALRELLQCVQEGAPAEAGEDARRAEKLLQGLRGVWALSAAEESLRAFTRASQSAHEAGLPEGGKLLERSLGFAADVLLRLPRLFPDGLPLLTQERGSARVSLSRRQCAALLAAGLFGALPPQLEEWDLPGFEFSFILNNAREKSLCLLSYLWQIAEAGDPVLEEVVSFSRRNNERLAENFWSRLEKPLLPARFQDGLIEESDGNLQADFANEYLGGGALGGGNVQEEIRFAVSPECLVGMLFCEKMLPNEAITIVGTQQYSKYVGYGGSFRFAGPCTERRGGPQDARGRFGPHIVAFDALVFPGNSQYGPQCILRELLKSYVACLGDLDEGAEKRCSAFATGNWGCGVFGGDPQLKSLIQWLAASAAGLELVYFPFGDSRVDELPEVFEALKGRRCCDLYHLLKGHSHGAVFEEVKSAVRRERTESWSQRAYSRK